MASGTKPYFTPTEERIVKLLSDGKPHNRDEVKACLNDEFADYNNLNYYLNNIRKKVLARGQDIVCVFRNRRLNYQHIKKLVFQKPSK